MKLLILFLSFNFIVLTVYSQETEMRYDSILQVSYKIVGKDTLYFETPSSNSIVVERKHPVFIGNLKNFIKENLNYPEAAKKENLEGQVDISCQIDSNGVPRTALVLYSTSPVFEEEALRLVHLMRWKWDKAEPNKEYWSEHIKIEFRL